MACSDQNQSISSDPMLWIESGVALDMNEVIKSKSTKQIYELLPFTVTLVVHKFTHQLQREVFFILLQSAAYHRNTVHKARTHTEQTEIIWLQ